MLRIKPRNIDVGYRHLNWCLNWQVKCLPWKQLACLCMHLCMHVFNLFARQTPLPNTHTHTEMGRGREIFFAFYSHPKYQHNTNNSIDQVRLKPKARIPFRSLMLVAGTQGHEPFPATSSLVVFIQAPFDFCSSTPWFFT